EGVGKSVELKAYRLGGKGAARQAGPFDRVLTFLEAAYFLRRSPDRTLEQVSDLALQDGVGRQPDRIAVALGFEELVDLRVGEGCVAAEIAPLHRAPVADDHRLQHVPPAGGAVHVA